MKRFDRVPKHFSLSLGILAHVNILPGRLQSLLIVDLYQIRLQADQDQQRFPVTPRDTQLQIM